MDKTGSNGSSKSIDRRRSRFTYAQNVGWDRIFWTAWQGFLRTDWQQWEEQSWLVRRLIHGLAGWHGYGLSLNRSRWLEAVLDAALLLIMVLLPVAPVSTWYGLTGLLVIKWFCFTGVQSKRKASPSLILLTISVAIGPWLVRSEYRDVSQWFQMINHLLMALLIARTFTISLIRKWLNYSILTGFFWLLVGFWQKLSGMVTPAGWLEAAQNGVISVRIFSVFVNPNNYALYLAIQLVLLTETLRQTSNSSWLRRGCALLWTPTILALYWTYSRSGWLAGGGYLLWRLWRIPWSKWRRLEVAGIALIVIMGLSDWGPRLESLVDGTANTLGYRMRIWRELLVALMDYGWQGAGPGAFSRLYPWYQTQGSVWVQHAHQWYLQFWLEYGLIGFIPLLAVIAGRLVSIRLLAPALIGAIGCFLLVGFVENWSNNLFLGGCFWILVGLSLAMGAGGYESDE